MGVRGGSFGGELATRSLCDAYNRRMRPPDFLRLTTAPRHPHEPFRMVTSALECVKAEASNGQPRWVPGERAEQALVEADCRRTTAFDELDHLSEPKIRRNALAHGSGFSYTQPHPSADASLREEIDLTMRKLSL